MEQSLDREQIAPVWFYGLAVLITQMDGGAVSTLLSAVMKEYDLNSANASWMAGLYTLGLVVFTPLVANLADTYGQRRVFLTELILWFAGALITFISPAYWLVLLGRALQAAGDCGIIVMSIDAMIAAARQGNQGRKVSLMGIMSGLAALLAPVIAGLTLGVSGNWHNFYGLMLPLILILFLLGWKVLPGQAQSSRQSTDRWGAVIFCGGLAAWMLALTLAQHLRRYAALVAILVVVGLVAFFIFPRVEGRLTPKQRPFLPVHLMSQALFRDVILLGVLGGMFFALFVYIPTYAGLVFHLPVQLAGMILTAPGLGSIIGSLLGGVLVDKAGSQRTLVIASILLAAATIAIAATITNLRAFLICSFVMGCGMGALMSSPLQVIAGRLATRQTRAEAIGGLSAAKKVGLTIAPLLFATSMDFLRSEGGLTVASFRSIFVIAAILALFCLLIAVTLPLEENNLDK